MGVMVNIFYISGFALLYPLFSQMQISKLFSILQFLIAARNEGKTASAYDIVISFTSGGRKNLWNCRAFILVIQLMFYIDTINLGKRSAGFSFSCVREIFVILRNRLPLSLHYKIWGVFLMIGPISLSCLSSGILYGKKKNSRKST